VVPRWTIAEVLSTAGMEANTMSTVVSEAPVAKAGSDWDTFLDQVREVVMSHPVVTSNDYCTWFNRGEASREQVRDLIQQFSVFSNLFIVAQLLKTINAPTMMQARESCEILVNELGVVFNSGRTSPKESGATTDADKDREGDPELVSTEGTVDGGVYRFNARHFEWLVKVGEAVGLGFDDLGKRKFGREETLFFCDELSRIYGSDDPDIAEGASFAVEHWAAAGFWKELINGLDAFKNREAPDLRLAFFTWHDRVEDQHAAHTMDELEGAFKRPGFDQQKFLDGAAEMLNGVKTFWDGLEKRRQELETVAA
jgi:pyrroloquinoline quinone (PQQ) biosynthesis protein C